MHVIRKRIVTDEESRPVAVQIDYEDWLEIERLLEGRGSEEDEASDPQEDEFEAAADELAGTWKGGDGLEYQIRIREEWDGR